MHWRTRAAIFRVLSAAPMGHHIHYLLQRHVTHEWPRPARSLDQLLVAARRIVAHAPKQHARFLEIGAGGDLAVAIGLRMLGVEHVTCVDLNRIARLELIRHAASHLSQRLAAPMPPLRSWEDLAAFGIDYVAPKLLQDAVRTPQSFDGFYSVDTLEHIPVADLRSVLRHARGLLAPGGVSVHLIDYSDHYARSDNKLSRFNFLKFDEGRWQPFNSPLQYVNRLRHSQYLRLFAEAGMTVIHAEPELSQIQAEIVEQLAHPFRDMDHADLFTLRAMLVATP